ncbi:hypothetical protein [Nocardioides sp.]|uniref:hypothetical protein n=1 Tax=Nocardioides sp. TaxID=35761 RepID=UPI0035149363
MVILGLVLLVVGALGIVSGIFGSDAVSAKNNNPEHVTYLGIDMNASTLFVIAVISTLLVVLGLWLMKSGAKRGWKRRKEQKRLSELSEKLDRAEAERRGDDYSGREQLDDR